MLDSFFNKGFKAAKCKTLLKLTVPRIKLLRNRREIQLKQMRKDIANLLENGQEATARIRVEHIIREENMMAAQEIIELFCELIAVRLPIIEIQRECPLDLKEAISSICFAAPRCSDLPELFQVQILFASKYGKEFVAAATELMPDCGVNRQIIQLLSVHAPSVETKLKLLKEIAEEHEVDWDPAATESEFLKPHEDLLNGPNYISGSAALPLPKEKHIASPSRNTVEEIDQPDSDSGVDSWDFPEVPRSSVQADSDSPQSPAIVHHPHPPPSPFNSEVGQEEPKEKKQFIPFVSPPSPPSPPPAPLHAKLTEASTPPSQVKSEAKEDLQDVLAAAQAAAESAEQAAAAARAAASLARLRIAELNKKSQSFHDSENGVNQGENPTWNQHNLDDDVKHVPSWDSGTPTQDLTKMEAGSPDYTGLIPDYNRDHKPQRSTSLEDYPYFSYPNLFSSRQDSNLHSSFSSPENSRPAHDS
ncbi:IST1 homolog [Phalaenopsis equestris]|uniref:IST1 homolog n=1 Tax=Phalaenopsis equestris TaxID=78828 RepID=UPI0009E49A4A|nr:IST1 homolog [Phalaenopsis equestris]XP_020575486.1 IST1 homolog [Phalaenopsis equestris]